MRAYVWVLGCLCSVGFRILILNGQSVQSKPLPLHELLHGLLTVPAAASVLQAVLTNAWACAAERPLVDRCIDSWTDVPSKRCCCCRHAAAAALVLQAVLTNAWACAAEKPLVDRCVDSWTDVPLKVPVAGLMPYPAEGAEDPDSNMFVTVTPVAMTTLGDTSSASIRSKYATAFTKLAVQMPSTANPVHAGA